jgi:hypothetical protein
MGHQDTNSTSEPKPGNSHITQYGLHGLTLFCDWQAGSVLQGSFTGGSFTGYSAPVENPALAKEMELVRTFQHKTSFARFGL